MTETAMRLLIVNPNTSAATTAMMVDAAGWAAAMSGADATVVGTTSASGPAMIVDPQALAAAATPTVSAAINGVQEHRPDALIVAAFGDPGAAELRAQLTIPVIGIGEAAVREAAQLGRFAIVTSTPLLKAALEQLVTTHCPDADFAGVHFSTSDPRELARDPDRNVDELSTAIDDAIAVGAECVVIGGGPLASAARRLARRTDVAVIEPVPSAVRSALGAVQHAVLASEA